MDTVISGGSRVIFPVGTRCQIEQYLAINFMAPSRVKIRSPWMAVKFKMIPLAIYSWNETMDICVSERQIYISKHILILLFQPTNKTWNKCTTIHKKNNKCARLGLPLY